MFTLKGKKGEMSLLDSSIRRPVRKKGQILDYGQTLPVLRRPFSVPRSPLPVARRPFPVLSFSHSLFKGSLWKPEISTPPTLL